LSPLVTGGICFIVGRIDYWWVSKGDRAQAGTQGHRQVHRSCLAGYQSEVEIAYWVENADPPMEARGRIDGLYASEKPVIISEIKTTTLSLELNNKEHNPCIGQRRNVTP
jgi:hypothetical protein